MALLEARGSRRSMAGRRCCTASTSPSRRAASPRFWAPTARVRRRRCARCAAWSARRAKKYYPEGALDDQANAYAYSVAQTLVQVLKQCGNDLSRENIMKQAASLKNLELPLLLPGIKINTSATDFAPIEQEQLARFDGERWVLFGELYDAAKR